MTQHRKRIALSPSDFTNAETIAEAAGGNGNLLFYVLDPADGLWKVYESATPPGNLMAVMDPLTGIWRA